VEARKVGKKRGEKGGKNLKNTKKEEGWSENRWH